MLAGFLANSYFYFRFFKTLRIKLNMNITVLLFTQKFSLSVIIIDIQLL